MEDAHAGSAKADWYVDPTARHEYRYWDGTMWTANVADSGVASVDPLAETAAVEDSSAENGAGTGVTLVECLREFMVANGDDMTLADIDAMRDIVNSGCEAGVVARCSFQGGPATKRFVQELKERGFVAAGS